MTDLATSQPPEASPSARVASILLNILILLGLLYIFLLSIAIFGAAFKLVGKEYFEDDYVKKIESLKPSWSVYCLRMALDKKVIDFEAAFTIHTPDMEKYDRIVYDEQRVPDDMLPHIMITSPSNLDPSLAPEGKQLIIAIGGCLYEPKENWSKWEEKILLLF